MPKLKIARKSVALDMTAMCDMAFLLLTFFMLATTFKPVEVAAVDTPSSHSKVQILDKDMMMISVRGDGAVFFGMDGQFNRENLLKYVSEKYKVQFTPAEIKSFSLLTDFGVPLANMKQFLHAEGNDRKKFHTGIPSDSTRNELRDWIFYGRYANSKVRIAIKGDKETNYSVVSQIIQTLQDQDVNQFNLITSMEK